MRVSDGLLPHARRHAGRSAATSSAGEDLAGEPRHAVIFSLPRPGRSASAASRRRRPQRHAERRRRTPSSACCRRLPVRAARTRRVLDAAPRRPAAATARRSCHSLYGVGAPEGRRHRSTRRSADDDAHRQAARDASIPTRTAVRARASSRSPTSSSATSGRRCWLLLGGAALLLLIACVNVVEPAARAHRRRGGASWRSAARSAPRAGASCGTSSPRRGAGRARRRPRRWPSPSGACGCSPGSSRRTCVLTLPFLAGPRRQRAHAAFAAPSPSLAALALLARARRCALPATDVRDGMADGGRGRVGPHVAAARVPAGGASSSRPRWCCSSGAGLLGRSVYRLLQRRARLPSPSDLATCSVAAPGVRFDQPTSGRSRWPATSSAAWPRCPASPPSASPACCRSASTATRTGSASSAGRTTASTTR